MSLPLRHCGLLSLRRRSTDGPLWRTGTPFAKVTSWASWLGFWVWTRKRRGYTLGAENERVKNEKALGAENAEVAATMPET
jgi:hypothetical protein